MTNSTYLHNYDKIREEAQQAANDTSSIAKPIDYTTTKPIDLTNPKDLIGAKKPRLSLLPAEGVIQGAKAMSHGAEKYGPYNWREKNVQAMIYIDAILRHTFEFLDGSDKDADSGLHPMAHVVANGALLLDAIKYGNLIDNRPGVKK